MTHEPDATDDPGAMVTGTRPRRRRRGRLMGGLVAVVVIAALALGAVQIFGESGQTTKAASTASTTTAAIQRGTLVDRQSVSGTLTYGDSTAVGSTKSGTITAVAAQGSTVKRNGVLWRIDEYPTVLLYGAVPAYRAMTEGDTGSDVRQLNVNLKALGYGDPGTADSYTSGTTSAVDAWQEALGVTQTGTVALGDIVFQPGASRVGSVVSAVGTTAARGTAVLQLTSTTRVVSVDLSTSQQSLAFRGEPVIVTMPDGSAANGKVTEIGTVATSTSSSSSGAGGTTGGSSSSSSSSSTVPVTITLSGKVKSAWDQAPVQVAMQSSKRDNILIAPVTALLALQEGGYAVEVVNGSSSRLVAVKTGLFAGGNVEVSGSGIKAGTTVKVPVSL
jgi:peptidoglycan hydrolase-like protein with peptidoglycan-binding domain